MQEAQGGLTAGSACGGGHALVMVHAGLSWSRLYKTVCTVGLLDVPEFSRILFCAAMRLQEYGLAR